MKREETSGISDTVWLATSKSLKFSPLRKNISVDVAIIGGGISGMTIAYMLANSGKKVAVVEDGWLGSGETGRTTAHISYQLEMDYSELIKIHGKEKAKIVADSHKQAIDTIESIVKKEGIDCDFERLDGYFSGNRKDLKNELKAMHSLGFHEVRPVNSPINSAKKSCLLFPWQAQFHVIKYIKGLANAFIKNKGQIFTGTHAEKIDENGIQTEKGFRINSKHIVVATNAPVNENSLYMKQAAYRTYALAALIPKNSVSRILLWDTEIRPYHYIRIKDYNESFDILIAGGEDHRTGQKNDGRKRYLALETFARKLFPMIKKITFRWSGQVLESNDGLAFIGKNPGSEKIYVATGDSGNGMTYSVIAGILISDLIFGRKNPWEEIYNPGRKSVFMTKRFFQETVKTAEQYIDWLKIENVYPKLKKNEGTILQTGLKKIAAYRDRKGKMQLHSAVCPHRGCVVQWNDSEKSFDCPCHGSRFTAEGDVVNGPANKGLSKWKEESKE